MNTQQLSRKERRALKRMNALAQAPTQLDLTPEELLQLARILKLLREVKLNNVGGMQNHLKYYQKMNGGWAGLDDACINQLYHKFYQLEEIVRLQDRVDNKKGPPELHTLQELALQTAKDEVCT